jgi:hypothetical protein
MAEEIGNERTVFGYSPLDGTFSLYIYRCPACGATGKEGSWCTGHSAPPGTVPDDVRLEIRREPVLVPQADPEQSVSRYSDEAA